MVQKKLCMTKLKNLQLKYSFYCDENFPTPSMKYMKRRGFKVMHCNEMGNLNKSDKWQISFAKKTKSILLTNDFDFVSFKNKGIGLKNTGIILFNSANPLNTNKLIDRLIKYILKTDSQLWGNITSVSSSQIRQR